MTTLPSFDTIHCALQGADGHLAAPGIQKTVFSMSARDVGSTLAKMSLNHAS